uniref:Guanine nucleotide-binding protein alpha subunit n=1 Tax=Oryza nivara TaxID=4536 RepID=A0A0E0HNT1_ORYNI
MWIIHHHKEWLEQGRGAGAELHLASRVGEGKGSCRSHSLSEAETAENAKIKLLFQTGFDEAELRSYTSVIHANVYQTIKILYEGAKELSQVESDSSKYVISPDNQETYLRGSILQLPDCAQYFMENLDRLAEADYVPTKGAPSPDWLQEEMLRGQAIDPKQALPAAMIFEKKIQKVKAALYTHTEFKRIVKKFEELYIRSSRPDCVDHEFKIYRTTALDQKLVKKTFKLIDESMRCSREGT